MRHSFLILGLLAMACESEPEEMQPVKITVEVIEGAEERLLASGDTASDAQALQLVQKYLEYVETYPEDSLVPEYLYKAGALEQAIPGKQERAVYHFRTLAQKYPRHRRAPMALFMTGFTFDQWEGHAAEAAEAYLYFADTYPDHPMAEQALMLAGLTQENLNEVVEQWQQKNK